ncbi:heme-dependent oxidative N-demethylase family protein [Gordonia sp. NPDC003429]
MTLAIPHTPTGAAAEYLAAPVDHLSNIPWPFPDDLEEFSYSVNVEPARVPRPTRGGEWGRHLVDLGGAEYPQIMAERRRILDEDPSRVRIRPGMEVACWDLLLYYLRDLALDYPQFMHLDESGDGRLRWRNDLLGTDAEFALGENDSLPNGPMDFLAREVPDDLLLVVERDGRLYFDAGVVTFAAAWSVSFDVGMDMYEIHAPVPGLIRQGVVARAEQFLRRLPADQVYRRVNWTLSASDSHKLDVSLEELPEWGRDVPLMVRQKNFGDARLRIELEHFVRLPMSGAVTFNIRTFMASLDDVRRIPAWAEQLATVIETLDENIAAYKGFLDYRDDVVAYLRTPPAG